MEEIQTKQRVKKLTNDNRMKYYNKMFDRFYAIEGVI